MSLLSSIQRRIYTPEMDSLKQWQERSFIFVLVSISIAALPPLLVSVPRAIKDGMWINLTSYVIGYLFCLSLIFVKRIPFRLRAWIGVLVFMGIGSLAILTIGPVGSGRIWLFATSVFATLTLGIRAGIIILFAQLGILTLFGYLLNSQHDRWSNTLDYTLNSWVVTSFTFTFLSIVSILAMGGLIKGLSLTLERSREAEKQLLKTTEQLNQKIEAHKKSEIYRRESEERWLFALEGAGDGVWDWDVQSDRLFFSAQWKKMLGFEEHEIGTQIDEWFERVHPEDKETVREEINNILYEQADNFQLHYRIRCKDRSFLYVLGRGKVMTRNEEEKPVRIIGTISDTTFIKEMEDQKIAYEMRLQQSQKMEAIGTLAGGIAHDFNNILTPIMGHTELVLRTESENSYSRDSLKEIYTATRRAKELVRQILTFSRQENLELRPVNISPIANEALKFIRASIPSTITMHVNIEKDCGFITADPTHIHQIIMNLTTNSYHAMEANGGEMTIQLNKIKISQGSPESDDISPGEYALLQVEDTGEGIAENVKDKIFNPFYTTKQREKGTGMGLSVVHGIVKNMDGYIFVNSQPEMGTKFSIYFPVTSTQGQEENRGGYVGYENRVDQGSGHILLIDDEDDVAQIESNMLEYLGYSVTKITSSTEALQLFKDAPNKFDLVLTDMAMPNLSGEQLAAECKKIRIDIPVLLCSGFSENSTRERGDIKNIDAYLSKPVTLSELSKKVREILQVN